LDKLSLLNWDLKPLVYLGLQAGIAAHNPDKKWGFFAGFRFKGGMPMKTGLMSDSDWEDGVSGDPIKYTDYINYYSTHDNYEQTAIYTDVEIGGEMRFYKNFLFKAYLSYSFMYFNLRARNGIMLYPSGSFNTNQQGTPGNHYSVNGQNVCEYQQIWNIVSPAVSVEGVIAGQFSFKLSLALSPFVFVTTRDDHLMRENGGMVIYGTQYIGLYAEPALEIRWSPKTYFTLSVNISYRSLNFARGPQNKHYNDAPKDGTAQDSSAAGCLGSNYNACDIGLLFIFRLGV
jgi:hypothetical protein